MNTDDLLRRCLRTHATHIAATSAPPPATLVYLRAERRARRHAAERAILPLRIMQAIGVLFATTACAWLLHKSPATPPTSPILLTCAASALLLALLGCITMLRASRLT